MSISIAHRAAVATHLEDAADQVREKLRDLSFLPHWNKTGAALRDELLITFSELILPRLGAVTRPLLVVVAGSTGAGKSTLVNSILGQELTKASVLRPTTRRPVLLHNPEDQNPVGSEMADEVEIVSSEALPRGLALIDAPDIDSILTENRERALKVLSGADLWLFVTTPTRYGDAVPWQVLELAAEREVSIAVVLNRTGAEEKRVVRADLAERLRKAQLWTAPLFVVDDAGAHHGLLPAESVEPVSRWLKALSGSAHSRVIEQRSLRGALATVAAPLAQLEELLNEQDAALARVAAECTVAEDLLRDRAQRPLAQIESASEEIAAAWRKFSDTWHLLNVPSGERLRLRRKDRAAVTSALHDVSDTIDGQLIDFPVQQHSLLNSAVLKAVEEVELGSQWRSQHARPDPVAGRFDSWGVSVAQTAAEWTTDKSNKLRRQQARSLGEAETANLLKAAAAGLRGARALLGTIFGESAIDVAEELAEKMIDIQGAINTEVVGGIQNQLLALLPKRKSGEQLARVRKKLQEAQ